MTSAATSMPDPSETHLRLVGLSKVYPGQASPAVDSVDLAVKKGTLLALLGPSGCGKTTTLRMIAGLLDASGGRIELDGVNIVDQPAYRRGMGMVFQSYALFPHLDVKQNVAFGLEMRKFSRPQIAERVHAALEMVHLAHLADRRVKELSGGQQQRIALARALVIEPSVLLLDEPLSNLDAKLREAMRAEIRAIVQRLKVTTVFVTHDQGEALSMADTIVVMNSGRVEQIGSPQQIYNLPRSRFVADFIGRANLLPGTVVAASASRCTLAVDGLGTIEGLQPSEPLTVGGDALALVRPHHVDLDRSGAQSDAENRMDGRVTDISYTGELVAYTVVNGANRLTVEEMIFPSYVPHTLGSSVTARWQSRNAIILRP